MRNLLIILLIINVIILVSFIYEKLILEEECKKPTRLIKFKTKPLEIEIKVKLYIYNPDITQCDSHYHITASGLIIDTIHPYRNRYIAISKDLKSMLKFKDTVEIRGTWVYDGLWIVADRMNKRHERAIDILWDRKFYRNIPDSIIIRKYIR